MSAPGAVSDEQSKARSRRLGLAAAGGNVGASIVASGDVNCLQANRDVQLAIALRRDTVVPCLLWAQDSSVRSRRRRTARTAQPLVRGQFRHAADRDRDRGFAETTYVPQVQQRLHIHAGAALAFPEPPRPV